MMKEIGPRVPTGYVPRPTVVQEAIAQAIDDYLLMERKARAWDELRALCAKSDDPAAPLVVELMARLVHPAQDSSKC